MIADTFINKRAKAAKLHCPSSEVINTKTAITAIAMARREEMDRAIIAFNQFLTKHYNHSHDNEIYEYRNKYIMEFKKLYKQL